MLLNIYIYICVCVCVYRHIYIHPHIHCTYEENEYIYILCFSFLLLLGTKSQGLGGFHHGYGKESRTLTFQNGNIFRNNLLQIITYGSPDNLNIANQTLCIL